MGAPLDDNPGINSGSAYLFDFSDPCNIIEIKLTASDAAASDWFGSSVAISGTTAIVGAYRDDDAGIDDPFCNSGSAYLFDVTTGVQLLKLTASATPPALDNFGWSVAISGDTAIVGARYDDDACPADPCCNSGSAYLFAPADTDGDGVPEDVDNCPAIANLGQEDSDGDGIGDACDNCPDDPENDADADGICGDVDNCPYVYNPDQTDVKPAGGDGVGDACQNDFDGDGINDNTDNCPDT